MRVVIVHNKPAGDRPDQNDTLIQVEAVAKALSGLGHQVSTLPVDLDLEVASSALNQARPDLVFNLVEELAGDMRLAPMGAALFEHLKLPFTGSSSRALVLSGDKLLCKRLLAAASIPTPAWTEDGVTGFSPGRYLLKSATEHASMGLDDQSIVQAASPEVLAKALARSRERFGGEWFAESFVDGREFNITMLAGTRDGGPEVLPPAEILFQGYGQDRPRIVGYAAKWNEDSFEYANTPRTFDFPGHDQALLQNLRQISRACWRHLGLHGYVRVDFRVDSRNNPLVIDVNANPCVSPDGGFAAASERVGLDYSGLVGRIVQAALDKHGIGRSGGHGR